MFFRAILLVFLILGSASAKAYKPYDHEAMLKKDANGSANIYIKGIFEAVEELWTHAKTYPLDFDNEEDQTRAFADVQTLERVFEFLKNEKFTANFKSDNGLYFDVSQARIFVMEHNFDIAGAAQKADEAYTKILSQNSQNGELHNEFGLFLGSSGHIDRAKNRA
ncbi:MAG: hypothetical protein LUC34_05130 [Campylobacter sp.]|nr:hypothetical protein [Campylobacter sp.]